jgi:hypothetical protein
MRFSAGQSPVEAQFQVYTLAPGGPARLLAFTTHVDSGMMPGAGAVVAGEAMAGPEFIGMTIRTAVRRSCSRDPY